MTGLKARLKAMINRLKEDYREINKPTFKDFIDDIDKKMGWDK